VVVFGLGGFTGLFLADVLSDVYLHDTFFVVGHFHYTLFAGSLFGLLAGVHYWFPKATGAMLREGLGKLSFWLLVIGANVTFFPMFFLGFDGMQRRVPDYAPRLGDLNLLSSIGAGVIALGILVFLVNVLVSLRRRQPAGDDPWQGQTLEWATSSPPPPNNFQRPLPPIESHAPLLDRLAEEPA